MAEHARWPELRGTAGMQLGDAVGRNPIEQDGRDARTPGEPEARLDGCDAVERDRGRHRGQHNLRCNGTTEITFHSLFHFFNIRAARPISTFG
ncbi:MAG: hypothetical protein NTU95_10805 [Methanothrix sp.]|nr:hypothetical protein [Methanothrix sp.]